MPVKTMARPFSSAASITSLSRSEPPGWMTAVAPASAAARSPSAKGKKASEATTLPIGRAFLQPGQLARFGGADGGDARAVAAVHLARAHAHRGAVLGIDDGVRLHVLADGEGEQQVLEFLRRRRALGHDLQVALRSRGRCRGSAGDSRRPRSSRSCRRLTDRAGCRPAARARSSSWPGWPALRPWRRARSRLRGSAWRGPRPSWLRASC